MANQKLSIYIPTFNRYQELIFLLNCLYPQKIQHSDRVEVVVSDNSSTDATAALLELAAQRGFIDVFVRRSKNVGADANIKNCYKYTTGDYIWILCDDDLPTNDSIYRILKIIDANVTSGLGLIYLNRSIETMAGQVITPVASIFPPGFESSVANVLCNPGLDLLTASTLVLRRRTKPHMFAAMGDEQTLTSPFGLALDAIIEGPVHLCRDPLVRYREGDKTSWVAQWGDIKYNRIPNLVRKFCEHMNLESDSILATWTYR